MNVRSSDLLKFRRLINDICTSNIDKIGIGCTFLYLISESYGIHSDKLKGSDAIIYELCDKIGISPVVESITFMYEDDDEHEYPDEYPDEDTTFEYGIFYFNNPSEKCNDQNDSYGPDHVEYFKSNRLYFTKTTDDIVWLNNPREGEQKKAGSANFVYGNYPATHQEFYRSSVIICDIKTYMINTIKNTLQRYLTKDTITHIINYMY